MVNVEVTERVTRRWLDSWENFVGSSPLRFAVGGGRRKVRELGSGGGVVGGVAAATSGVWAAGASPAQPASSPGPAGFPLEDRDMAIAMSVVSSGNRNAINGGSRRGRDSAGPAAAAAGGEREVTRRKRRGGGLLWRPEVAVANVEEEECFQESGSAATTSCWEPSTEAANDTSRGVVCGGAVIGGGGGGGGGQLKKLWVMAAGAVAAPAGAAAASTKLSVPLSGTSTALPNTSAVNDKQAEEVLDEPLSFSAASLPSAAAAIAPPSISCNYHHHHHHINNNNNNNNNINSAASSNDPVGIDCLADLALATVFSHLSSRDLSNVSLVCKGWCDLADHTRTHLKLKISNLYPEDGVDSSCATTSSFSSSSSSGSQLYPDPDELLHRLLMRWPSLTHVELDCAQSSPMRTPGRYRSRMGFGNHAMDLVGMICGSRLEELVLIECLHIDASSIATCLRRCKNLKRLHIERLNLRGCFHGAGAFACYCSIQDELVQAISEIDTLTHLWIEGCTGQITSGQLTRVLSTANLESLSLDVKMWPWPEIVTLDQGAAGGGGGGGGAGVVADAPSPSVVFPLNNKMKELTWISLHPMYYANFVTLTSSCTALESLNLSCCILEAGIMGVVMRELSKGLVALRLLNCSFGGHSLLPFPEVLCPKLKELQIVGTSGAADIQCIAESCPALRRLVVEEPEIMMLQERHVSCGCGLGGAIYRLATRARRALRVRSRRLSTWQPGAVF